MAAEQGFLPRVNFEVMQRYAGRRVLLVGQVKSLAGDTVVLKTSDDADVSVQTNPIQPADWSSTQFVEARRFRGARSSPEFKRASAPTMSPGPCAGAGRHGSITANLVACAACGLGGVQVLGTVVDAKTIQEDSHVALRGPDVGERGSSRAQGRAAVDGSLAPRGAAAPQRARRAPRTWRRLQRVLLCMTSKMRRHEALQRDGQAGQRQVRVPLHVVTPPSRPAGGGAAEQRQLLIGGDSRLDRFLTACVPTFIQCNERLNSNAAPCAPPAQAAGAHSEPL